MKGDFFLFVLGICFFTIFNCKYISMKILSFVLILVSLISNAQTHRFFYEVQYKKDSLDALLTKEFYHLDITKESLFYGRDYYIMDSIVNNNIELNSENAPSFTNITFHDKGSSEYTECILDEYQMYKMPSKDVQTWKLHDEKKKVGQYTLQKATTTWGGRKWIAWFTPEIPFQEGPYKFHGLPGLIMEISDDKANYSFKVIKSQNMEMTQPSFRYFGIFYEKAVPLSWEKFRKLKLSNYVDPLSFMKNGGLGIEEGDEVLLNDGTLVTSKNQNEVRADQQRKLRKYNNPIDLTKAIPYPSK